MEEKKKSNAGLIVLVVILLLACIGMGCYIGYDKFLSDNKCITEEKSKRETNSKNEKQTIIEQTQTETKEESNTTSSKVRCYGTYYVNGDKNIGVYTLKEDGTWNNENSEQYGVFTINENTITMIEEKHTVGPREEDPYYYNPKSYLISDDCSKIRLTESGSHTSATLDKAN